MMNSSCALAGGEVYCWGYNGGGQFGSGTVAADYLTATKFPPSGELVGKPLGRLDAARGDGLCFTLTTGETYCLGLNTYRTLGVGSSAAVTSPAQISFVSSVEVTAAFDGLACESVTATSDNQLKCVTPAHALGWVEVSVAKGSEAASLPSAYQYLDPFTLTPATGSIYGGEEITITSNLGPELTRMPRFSQISFSNASEQVVCGILDGAVYCWGNNSTYSTDASQIGNGASGTGYYYQPQAVVTSGVLAGKTITELSVGQQHVCALDAQGAAYCWGTNYNGQIGNGTTNGTNVPVAVQKPSTGSVIFTQVATGGDFTCGLTTTAQVYCWGGRGLGQGSASSSRIPILVPGLGSVEQLTVTYDAVCVLVAGEVWCWGGNNYGQVGNGSSSTVEVTTPTKVAGGVAGKSVTELGGGGNHMCVATAEGEVWCWGNNNSWQLGNTQNNGSNPEPVLVGGDFGGEKVVKIGGSSAGTCVLGDQGGVWCWGWTDMLGNWLGQNTPWPVAVDLSHLPTGVTVVDFTIGSASACVLGSDGLFYCWGQNNYGQLGSRYSSMQTIPLPMTFMSVTVGGRECVRWWETSQGLKCVTPPGLAGSSEVVVSRLEQTERFLESYQYQAGTLRADGVTPQSGGTAGGERLVVTGENLVEWGQARLVGEGQGQHKIGRAHV
jgi:alpha-tubulin suppressor-like RCC1 family protein